MKQFLATFFPDDRDILDAVFPPGFFEATQESPEEVQLRRERKEVSLMEEALCIRRRKAELVRQWNGLEQNAPT